MVMGTWVPAAVLVAGVEVAAAPGTVVGTLGTSSSSSSLALLSTNSTFVDTPPGYRYLYPCAHYINVLLLVPNFFCNCR